MPQQERRKKVTAARKSVRTIFQWFLKSRFFKFFAGFMGYHVFWKDHNDRGNIDSHLTIRWPFLPQRDTLVQRSGYSFFSERDLKILLCTTSQKPVGQVNDPVQDFPDRKRNLRPYRTQTRWRSAFFQIVNTLIDIGILNHILTDMHHLIRKTFFLIIILQDLIEDLF